MAWRLASERGQIVQARFRASPPSFVETAIRDRLLTIRGREVLNPHYGSRLRDFLGRNRPSDADVRATVEFALRDLVADGIIGVPTTATSVVGGGLRVSVSVPQLIDPLVVELEA